MQAFSTACRHEVFLTFKLVANGISDKAVSKLGDVYSEIFERLEVV